MVMENFKEFLFAYTVLFIFNLLYLLSAYSIIECDNAACYILHHL